MTTTCRRSEARASIAAAAAALLALSTAGCRPAPRWNVLLVTFDTTRADHLGAYGYPLPVTPNLDRLAAEGISFTRAFATNPITLPSHSSILTGTYPPYHGVRDNSAFVLRDDVTTLAEVLQIEGWTTAAVVGAFVLDSRFNLDQGFEVYDDSIDQGWSWDEQRARAANAFGFAERKANLVTAAARRWLARRGGRPFFLWLHYFDPHEPRNPPEPHHSAFLEPYDGEIAYADEQFGSFLEALRETGEYERTLIVVTADHGEGQMDHGEPTHSLLLFDTTLRVPLIVRIPGVEGGRRVSTIASGVDIMPTVLQLVGLPPPAGLQGRPLLRGDGSAIEGDRGVYMESFVGRLQHGWGELRALRTSELKLIHGPRPRLYRVADDPEEVYDLAAAEPDTVARLTAVLGQQLSAWASASARDSSAAADAEALRSLQSLGYAAGVAADERVSDDLAAVTGLDDPHERRYLFDLYGVASENLRTERSFEGIRQLEEIVAVDPDDALALSGLGLAYYLHAGQVLKARELFERSLAVEPRQELPRYFLSRIHFALGDLDAAADQCEAILEFQPQSLSALYELGRIHAARGDVAAAQRHYEAALAVDPSSLPTLLGLGTLHARRREHEPAGRYFRRALDVEADNPEVLYNVGIWYLQGDDEAQAASFLERAVERNPADGDAWFVLGRLYADAGRVADAESALRRARPLAVGDRSRLAEIDALLAPVAAPEP
ncbi:MAG: sulfatase-like hydrolase/transferase [Thermoanaerobaculia bacterium]